MRKWIPLSIMLFALSAYGQAPASETPTPAESDLLGQVQQVLDGVDGYTPVPETPSITPVMILDARQCVAMALRQNARALAAAEDAAAKAAVRAQAKSQRLPQAKFETAYVYTQELERQVGNGLAQLILETDRFMPEKGILTGKIGVEQVIYAGGQIQAAIRASDYLWQSEAWKRQATLDQIEFDAKQAFYDCLLAKALVEVAKDSVTTFERHQSDAKQMLEVGLVSRFELLRAETELGARQTDLESANTAAAIALLNLRRILGLPQDQPLELAGEMPWNPLNESLDALLAEAQENRAELRALADGISAAEANIDLKRGLFKPKAAAKAEWQISEGAGQMAPDGLRVTLGAQWDLYTGGKRKAEVQEAKAQLRSLEHQRTDVERLIDLDVRQAYLRVQEAIAKIRKEKGTVALGREGLRLAQLRFQEGAGTQADTLDAELAFTQARTTLAKALRDYAAALAALDKATGRSTAPREEAF